MKTPTPHYDPKCENLARHFLDEEIDATEDDIYRLAARLQAAAEEYLAEVRTR